jgi:hypothetical protein
MNMTVFCDVAPCSLVEIDRSFRGAYCLTACLRHHADRSVFLNYEPNAGDEE